MGLRRIILWDFEIQTDHLISAIRQDNEEIIYKKKRTSRVVDFTAPADHRVKTKESKKRDKYLDLAQVQRKLRSMGSTLISTVIGILETVSTGLESRLEVLEIGA